MNQLMGSNKGNVNSETVKPSDSVSMILSAGGSHGIYGKNIIFGGEELQIQQFGYTAAQAEANAKYRTPTNFISICLLHRNAEALQRGRVVADIVVGIVCDLAVKIDDGRIDVMSCGNMDAQFRVCPDRGLPACCGLHDTCRVRHRCAVDDVGIAVIDNAVVMQVDSIVDHQPAPLVHTGHRVGVLDRRVGRGADAPEIILGKRLRVIHRGGHIGNRHHTLDGLIPGLPLIHRIAEVGICHCDRQAVRRHNAGTVAICIRPEFRCVIHIGHKLPCGCRRQLFGLVVQNGFVGCRTVCDGRRRTGQQQHLAVLIRRHSINIRCAAAQGAGRRNDFQLRQFYIQDVAVVRNNLTDIAAEHPGVGRPCAGLFIRDIAVPLHFCPVRTGGGILYAEVCAVLRDVHFIDRQERLDAVELRVLMERLNTRRNSCRCRTGHSDRPAHGPRRSCASSQS